MSIEIDENIMGIWYVKLSSDLDLMLALLRDGKGYKIKGRTRQYDSPTDPWDGKDRKRWFGGSFVAADDDTALKNAHRHMVTVSLSFARVFTPPEPPVLFELRRGNMSVEEFGEKLRSMPWAHSMAATKH
jgi:hypothetical protein